MQRFSFGTLVSVEEGRPMATHLPFVVEEREAQIRLISHFARANPQWKSLENQQILTIFTEPHAYISPSHYDRLENVPTWNYISVHAYGHISLLNEEKQVFEVLEKMMESFEPTYKTQWESLSAEYKSRMARGITAFEIRVNELQAKEKLSQNKKENERRRILEAMGQSESEAARLIGEYMADRENLADIN